MFNFLKGIYHYLLAWAGNVIYGLPSKKLFVIGVTGTKGKTTTVELINAVLEGAGKRTAIISSLRFKIGDKSLKNTTGMTMPGRFMIQRLLHRAVSAGCEYAIVEVTSQGVLQHRHRFIEWNTAILLNLQPEHIEAHGSFEKYRRAKVDFFSYVAKASRKPEKFFFINEEDKSKSYFADAVLPNEPRYFSRSHFIKERLGHGKISIGDWLENNFNLENAAAATAIAESLGIDWPAIKKSLQNFKGVPGRLETIQQEPFKVVIDYAHTPDSLERVYQVLTERKSKSAARSAHLSDRQGSVRKSPRLICVLGAAGGGRDKWKRVAMGKIAAENCDVVVLTDEDPYDEDPALILNQIESGFKHALNSRFRMSGQFKILDRKEAIKKSLEIARAGDTVVITGKGSESWMYVAGGKKIPWCERCAVKELLESDY
ncbi:MAG: UDP-N-acetylmuramyl-tripeptide synthetase [Patescibacteria group bacterium]